MRRFLALLGIFPLLALAIASPEAPKSGYNPPLVKASKDADTAIARFQRDSKLQITNWAAEPLLAHPVAFAFDEKGQCYVAETFRHSRGVTDNRSHMYWLNDEMALRTVADRVELYRKDAKEKFTQTYEKERERVRKVIDSTGSGKADTSTVFRDDFGNAADGLAAGILARHGNVYLTSIPDLWLLKDTKNTGYADVKESLSTGYGVHTAFIGHDLHGLRMGPDGRLYFSCGDRGFNITTKEGKKIFYPDMGGVLRCDPDGSNLEVFSVGLRNPQELAFDDFGNLFTCDNNSDSGDQARFVHLVDGGDSGWRMGYQYGTAMHDGSVKQGNRGPWNYELLWKPKNENKAAYVLPPLRNYANGPSGFTYYPGLGLSDRYKNHFFLANFSGTPGGSGIYSFTTKPNGASFEMADDHRFIWNILSTDCDFGPDSAFYISDWVDGWDINGKGRIYKVIDPEAAKNPAIAEAKKLLAEGFTQRPAEELVRYLGHPHRDVRLESQFALAAKGREAIAPFTAVAQKNDNRLARVHAIWGLGMIARKEAAALESLKPLFSDSDLEVRANAAKSYGEATIITMPLLPLLEDKEPRVRMMAALAVARGGFTETYCSAVRKACFNLLKENDNRDPYLRHAASLALASGVPAEMLEDAKSNASAAIRLGSVLALRRQKSPLIAAFLKDSDALVLAETARAINDTPIPEALPALASLITESTLPEVVAYRVLNANYLGAKPGNAQALAQYAAQEKAPAAVRGVAVQMLGEWNKPPRLDYIQGLTQSLPERPQAEAIAALTPSLPKLFESSDSIKLATLKAVSKLDLKEAGALIFPLMEKGSSAIRNEALSTLARLKDAKLDEAVQIAIESKDAKLRNTARGIWMKSDPKKVVTLLKGVLEGSNIIEQQEAFRLLGEISLPESRDLLENWLDKLIEKKAPPALALDILEAVKVAKNQSDRLARRLKAFEESRPKDSDTASFIEVLEGGDAVRGREIVLNKAAVQCQRCHRLDGQGGDVGPPLNGAGKQTRQYLLEAIAKPNKSIAKGYETVLIRTDDGKSVTGVLRSETDTEVKIITPEGKPIIIKKESIEDQRKTQSAMPEDIITKLNKRELRDLVEFLSTLKEERK
jgi:quinoprotein glucose dehydrogenase